MSRLLLLIPCLFLPTTFTHAQGVPVIKVETHLIDTTLSVRDADGRIVTGLTQDDFTVVEDGVPQKIRFFAHDNQLPLSIGLIIDESGSQEKFVKEHEKDIEAFPTRSSNPTIRTSPSASVITFASSVTPRPPRHPSWTASTALTKATWTFPRSVPKKTAGSAPRSTTPSFSVSPKN